MINLGPSSETKRDPFILNPFYLYLDTCYTFNQNINTNTAHKISCKGSSNTAKRGDLDQPESNLRWFPRIP